MGEVIPLQTPADAASTRERVSLYIRLPDRPTLKLPLIARTRNGACLASEDTLPRYIIGRVSGERVERMYELVWQQAGMIGLRLVTASTMKLRKGEAQLPPFVAGPGSRNERLAREHAS